MSNSSSREQIKVMPSIHKLAFHWASKGIIGSEKLWRLASSLKAFEDGTYELPNGFIFTLESLDWTAISIYKGQYEVHICQTLTKLPTVDVFMDIGANLGVMTFAFAKKKSIRQMFAFEPVPDNVEKLSRNYCLMNLKVETINVAISNKEGVSTLYGARNPRHSGQASLSIRELKEFGFVNVETIRLDRFILENVPNEGKLFLKIDTEGHEKEVIEGLGFFAQSKRISGILMEVTPQIGPLSYLCALMIDTDDPFEVFKIEKFGKIVKRTRLKMQNFSDLVSLNKQENILIIRRSIRKDLLRKKLLRTGVFVFNG